MENKLLMSALFVVTWVVMFLTLLRPHYRPPSRRLWAERMGYG
jgi:hypothetical protein